MVTRRVFVFGAGSMVAVLALGAQADVPVALHGYDPVAYFTDGAPRRGDPAHRLEWRGQEWHFASAENKATFATDPSAFTPQYDGYCAWAVARNYLAPVDPRAWAIVDDKLYLNFDGRVQRRWARDPAGFIAKANTNWASLQPR